MHDDPRCGPPLELPRLGERRIKQLELVHWDYWRRFSLPLDAQIDWTGEHLVLYLRSPWELGGVTHAEGTVLAIGYDAFLAGARDFDVLVAPGPRRIVDGVRVTRDHLLVQVLDVAKGVGGQVAKQLLGTRYADVAKGSAYAGKAALDVGAKAVDQREEVDTPGAIGDVGCLERLLGLRDLGAHVELALLALEARHEGHGGDLLDEDVAPVGDAGAEVLGAFVALTVAALPPPPTTVVRVTASFGTVLLAAGTKGRRFALPNATIHMHQPLGGAQGQATDIEIQARQILRLKSLLLGILAKHTGQPLEVIERDSDRDYYLEAKNAVEYGLVDQVLESPKREVVK